VFTALLDTSVLWPSLQRDFLLSLAVEGMYRPVWSAEILRELEYEEAHKLVTRHGLDYAHAAPQASRLVATLRLAFDDAEVTGWEPLAGTYALPDPDDEHVLAAAVVAGPARSLPATSRTSPATRCPRRSTYCTPRSSLPARWH